jgi:hypothetical protein
MWRFDLGFFAGLSFRFFIAFHSSTKLPGTHLNEAMKFHSSMMLRPARRHNLNDIYNLNMTLLNSGGEGETKEEWN